MGWNESAERDRNDTVNTGETDTCPHNTLFWEGRGQVPFKVPLCDLKQAHSLIPPKQPLPILW